MAYQRPAFWRVPHSRREPEADEMPAFYTRSAKPHAQVSPGTPAARELIRGDIIAKVDAYDARDLRHEDAQNLFRNAGNQIRIVVQRGVSNFNLYSQRNTEGSYVGRCRTPTFKNELISDASRTGAPPSAASSRPPSALPASPLPPPYIPVAPYQHRPLSPLPSTNHSEQARRTPAAQLSPYAPSYSSQLSPLGSYRSDDDESIANQPYRTTPLVLPGAKVKREPGPTESYLRHHPNPAMRAPPHHDTRDLLMKQKRSDSFGPLHYDNRNPYTNTRVAESVLQRVVGDEAGSKIVHKQFNSPINLYSDNNIANQIKQTTTVPHKPTLQYDPAKSETFRALQEEALGDDARPQQASAPVQPKYFQAPTNRVPPTKRPVQPRQQPQQTQTVHKQNSYVNTLHEETIQQSNSFKRLMYNVLGDTEF